MTRPYMVEQSKSEKHAKHANCVKRPNCVNRGIKEETRRPICALEEETVNDIEFLSTKLKEVEAQIQRESCYKGHLNSGADGFCESCESLYDLYGEYHLKSFELEMEKIEAMAPNYRTEVLKPKGAKRDSTCWNHAPTRRRDRVQSKRLRASARSTKLIE
jgi:hypothetical protein